MTMTTTASLEHSSDGVSRQLKLLTKSAAVAVMAVGALVLTGWALKSVSPVFTSMKANTALSLVLAGAALLLMADEGAAQWRRRAGLACAVIVTLLGLLTFGQYIFGTDFGIDQLLFREAPGVLTSAPGRMGVNTACTFVLLGAALLLLDARTGGGAQCGQWATLAGMLVALAALVGYGYGVPYLMRFSSATQMAVHTALAFVVLAAGLLAARPRRALMALLTSRSAGGVLTRQMWPQAILLLLLLGWLDLAGHRAGWYETYFGTGLLVLAGIIFASLLIWRAACLLERLDAERQEAEDGEREADAKLRVTLHSIGDAVIATDAAGRISFMNAVAETLTGWTQVEAAGRPLEEAFRIVNEQTRATVETPVMKVIREGVTVGLANHTMLLARDGREVPIDDSGAPIRDEAGRIVGAVLVFRDIAERRKAESALQRSERDLADFFERASVGLHWVGSDGTILRVNQTELDLLGYSREEYLGRKISEFHADAPVIEDILVRLTRGETLHEYPARLRCKDGSIRDVLINSNVLFEDGVFLHTRCFTRDITERKQAENNLRYEKTLLEALTESVLDGILIVSPEGRMLHFNQHFLDIWNFPAEVVESKSDEAALAWAANQTAHPAAFRARIAAVYEQPDQSVREELLMKDGRVYERFGAPIHDGDRKLGWVWTFRNVTAAKRLLAAEREAREHAEAANRLKDEFLATVSHELRTPLNHMLGWAVMLRGGKLAPEKSAEALEIIERNVRTQNRLVEDLLDVSRIVTGKMQLHVQPVAAARVIEAAVASARPTAEARGIRLQVVLDSRPSVVSGDPDRLQQIVWNLVSNAVKFTPKDGRVQVRLEHIQSHVEITVSDTGEGIAPEFLPHVFDRFSQADGSIKRKQGGLGLGLAIVRHLVELHGGKVSVTSQGLGQGATFTVILPLRIADSGARVKDAHGASTSTSGGAEPSASNPLVAILKGVRVLVVDDESDSRLLVAALLAGSEAEVRLAGSLAEAITTLDEWRPDVMISDIGMPNGDGYELISAIRRRDAAAGQWLPAVALTAYARSEDRLRAIAAGFQMHIAKPVEPVELITVIASLTGRL